MPSQPPEKPPMSLGQQMNILFAILASICVCVTPFIRSRIGKNGIGLHRLFAVGVMYAWLAFYPCLEMLQYGAAWLAAVAIQRVCSLWQHHLGTRQMTTYDGYPALALALVPFAGEHAAKMLVEPALVAGAGYALTAASEGVGHFLMLGAAAIPIRHGIEMAIQRAADDAMADGQERMRQQVRRMQSRR